MVRMNQNWYILLENNNMKAFVLVKKQYGYNNRKKNPGELWPSQMTKPTTGKSYFPKQTIKNDDDDT